MAEPIKEKPLIVVEPLCISQQGGGCVDLHKEKLQLSGKRFRNKSKNTNQLCWRSLELVGVGVERRVAGLRGASLEFDTGFL